MSKTTMKYELGGKGNFLKIQIEEQDVQSQHKVKENNREVWRSEKIILFIPKSLDIRNYLLIFNDFFLFYRCMFLTSCPVT